MGHSFAQIIGVIFPVLTVIIGGACILQFSITTTLRASNTDLRERVKELSDELKNAEVKIASQSSEIEALRRVVTGEAHLVAIADLLDLHHKEALRVWRELEKVVTHTDKTMDQILAAMRNPRR